MNTQDGSDPDRAAVGSETPPSSLEHAGPFLSDCSLTARIEPFDSFWQAPEDIEKGYRTFGVFYEHNYLPHLPSDRSVRILVISCGPGYLLNLLRAKGFQNVIGIDSAPEKVEYAIRRGHDARVARVFQFLRQHPAHFDVIIGEQEINHLTKPEILAFLEACRRCLLDSGMLIIHSINGADPLTGSESRAGNFDHYNSFTEYSLKQVLEYSGFRNVVVVPLNLYVFYGNPFNYVAILYDKMKWLLFHLNYRLVGKHTRIYTKKIAGVCVK